MRTEEEERKYETVGNIRIKDYKKKDKKKKDNKKKKDSSDTPLGTKILVWIMFFAMLAAFGASVIIYFIQVFMNANS